jgi:phage FluMu protein Com
MVVGPTISIYKAKDKKDVPNLEIGAEKIKMEQMRCPHCGAFLGYQAIVVGAVRIKCRKCKTWCTLEIIPPPEIVDET